MSSIAITLNTILTACYRACYDDGVSDEDELVLVTAPISATSEVEALYTAGIIDWQVAIPSALHSLGCTSTEITESLRRRREQESKKEPDQKLAGASRPGGEEEPADESAGTQGEPEARSE